MNVNITSDECAWSRFEIQILGRTIKGLRGFGFKKEVDKEHLFAAGDEAIDIVSGNKKGSGNIKVLGFEADAMNKAARAGGYEDITDVPHELIVITCAYKKRAIDPISTYTASGVAFTECGTDLEQNAKFREITLPYLAMNVKLP
ncbi:hypothetical protein [Flavobacterium gilvum]|uniref:Uncharacterized protein n=1 Tax=Flavobacterium gilvum TaxID=1492737 RepID=A0AAC9I2L8_9FLAO|nr:hypothetical protein [Flavobacterium gilvum]AOW09519.1 hypothetical protein EM308_08405 [Flavobacterium gilvum]KFC60026.1 hypothetical protein FEM08_12050 [Flavobacterium gilvum]